MESLFKQQAFHRQGFISEQISIAAKKPIACSFDCASVEGGAPAILRGWILYHGTMSGPLIQAQQRGVVSSGRSQA